MESQQPEDPDQRFLTWTRPAEPPAPAVWGRHEHGAEKYTIREATPAQHDELLELYAAEYIPDEPASKNLGHAQDQVSMGEYLFLIKHALDQGISLVVTDDSEQKIVGAMILPVLSSADPELPELEGRAARLMLAMNHTLRAESECNPLTRSSPPPVTHYVADLGICVRRDRRRRGIAEAILRAVVALCRGLRIPHCSTLFTGASSQRLAAKVGFKEMSKLKYADFLDEQGEHAFHDMPEEYCRLMGVDFELGDDNAAAP